MKTPAALAALTLAIAVAAPASAATRDSYVFDDANLMTAAGIARVNQKVSDFAAQTNKEVVVVTVPALNGETAPVAAEKAFAQHQVNGVMIFVAKSDKKLGVVPDRASRQWFPSGTTNAIRDAMRASFNQGDFDGGINNGVDLVLSTYRSHLGSAVRVRQPVGTTGTTVVHQSSGGGMGWIWWLIILAVIFFVIRGIFRAMAGPRMYGGPGPGYGPGYGGGYGAPMMGGGGGFWSGLLGGLGGAWLGNELFGGGRRDYGGDGGYAAGDMGSYGQQDTSGFQSDAGQADMGNASFGDYSGGSGGGWGGDSGGGGWGGGDSGGGGDGGGGW